MTKYKLRFIAFALLIFIASGCNKQDQDLSKTSVSEDSKNSTDLPSDDNFHIWSSKSKRRDSDFLPLYFIHSHYLNNKKFSSDIRSYNLTVKGHELFSATYKNAIFAPFRKSEALPSSHLWTFFSSSNKKDIIENRDLGEVIQLNLFDEMVVCGLYNNKTAQQWKIYGQQTANNSFHAIIVNSYNKKMLEVEKLPDNNEYYRAFVEREYNETYNPNNHIANPDGIMDVASRHPELVFEIFPLDL